jgi:SAM-dependent methyltransferase
VSTLQLVRNLIPGWLKPPLRVGRQILRNRIATIGSLMRAHVYQSHRGTWLGLLPRTLRRIWRLEPRPPGSRRLEVGSGQQPQPGYIHVDVDPGCRSLDLLVHGPSLPLRDAWSDEILSIHMIEHVHPPMLRPTLREWFRVLRPGGVLRLHTPNGETLGNHLVQSAAGSSTSFWAIQSAIFGYALAPDQVDGPEALTNPVDHHMVLTFPVLQSLLEDIGFEKVEDISGLDPCHHVGAWDTQVPGLCLEVRAQKPEVAYAGAASVDDRRTTS